MPLISFFCFLELVFIQILLSIAVPPEQPTILDRFGRILNGTAGPYEEGDAPYLTCRVTGGKQNAAILYTERGTFISLR